MSANLISTNDGLPASLPGRGRWKIGAAIFAVAALAQAAALAYFQDDRTFSKMSVLFIWPAALFLLAIWWTFFSAQPWRYRLGLLGVIATGIVGLASVYVFDGVDGEMVPRFRYRWETSRKHDVEAYFAQQSPPKTVTQSAMVDEIAETPPEPLAAVEGDWPGFRGPHRDGIVQGVTLNRDWEQNPPRELWRHPVGLGWSGFSIVGEFAFTQEQRGPAECVVCYRLDDGSQVWVHEDQVRLLISEANGGDGPHGTPQFHDGLLYTLGGTGVLNCLDARTGQRRWTANILQDASPEGKAVSNIDWGMSGTPLVVENLVIVNPGGGGDPKKAQIQRSTIAYDRLTGEIVWTAGNYAAGYASPHFATIHSVPQVVMFHGDGIAGHELSTGRQLWNHPWKNGPKVNSAQPIVLDDGSVIFGCGYGKGSARIQIPESEDKPAVRWETTKFRPKFNDFVMEDGFVYGLDDGILMCLDVEKGKTKWKSGRYGYGQLLLVDDLLLILTEQGELVLVEAVPEGHREVAKVAALDPICWNHLAIAHGKLLIRNSHAAVCYELAE